MAHRKVVLCLLGATLAASLFSGCSGKKSDPVTVTVWTYYNGDQLDAFNDLTEKFNDTVGKKDGITVETKSLGTAEDLEQNVLAAVNGEVGASEVPNIFSAYSDTAYTMDQKDMLVDLSDYLTDKEKDEYVEEYLKEGDFSDDGSIKIFPVAKSTELLFLNDTDWQKFAEETRKSLKIKLHNLNDPVSSLSGGNQQKIVLGKELGTDPKIMLFNDPTRGIDVEAKSDFYNIMRKQATEGIGVVLCSSDMMEIIGMSDRVLVMYEGRITGELQKDELSEELIMKKSMGIVEEVAESDK